MKQEKTIYIKGIDIESLKDSMYDSFMFEGDQTVTICHTENKDEFVVHYPSHLTSADFVNDLVSIICEPDVNREIEGWFESDGSIYGIPLGRMIMITSCKDPEDEEYEEILLVDSQNQCYMDAYATNDDVKLTKDEKKYSESSIKSFVARPTNKVSATFHPFKAPRIIHEETYLIQGESVNEEKQHKGLLGFLCGLFK